MGIIAGWGGRAISKDKGRDLTSTCIWSRSGVTRSFSACSLSSQSIK